MNQKIKREITLLWKLKSTVGFTVEQLEKIVRNGGNYIYYYYHLPFNKMPMDRPEIRVVIVNKPLPDKWFQTRFSRKRIGGIIKDSIVYEVNVNENP